MKTNNSLTRRTVALLLAVMLVVGMLPAQAFAVSSSVITTTLGDEIYTVGQTANFTATTIGNEDAGTMVLGSFEIKQNGSPVNIADVAKLEYQESSTGTWYEFYGDFGPAATGFPLQAEATTSNFRVTFKVSGEYTVKVFVRAFANSEELCAVEKTVSVVKANPATITTTLGEEAYTVGQAADFTATTIGNEDAGTMVLGSFEIKKNGNPVNIADVAKLEYQESSTGTWYEFYGDFGPAATGFPLQAEATTSNFRVTFKSNGEYTVKVFVKAFANGEELCAAEKTVVSKSNQADLIFADKAPVIHFNDRADNKYTYTVQNKKGTVTYSIVSGSDIAQIDPTSGELTILKPGTIVVKAVDSGNALYNPAEATYTLTVHKGNQEIAFETAVPVDQWIGKPYTNTASGGDGTGKISYWLVSGEELVKKIANVAEIDTDTGMLTFLCVGTQVTVKAVKAADDYYSEATTTYSVTAVKKEPVDFGFATSGPITITYDPADLSYENPVVGKGESDIVTWNIVSGNDVADLNPGTGVLTIKKAGTIVIKATIKESPHYLEKSVEYTLNIQRANQAAIDTSKIPNMITYSPKVQEGLVAAAGGSGSGNFGYRIIEGDEFAKIDAATGAITILKAGNLVDHEFVAGFIKVEITKAGDGCYNAAEPVCVTISLERADQSGFAFAVDSDTVTYNDVDQNAVPGTGVANQYTLVTSGGQSAGDVTYELAEGDATKIQDGIAIIEKAGVVQIKATKAGDECYNACTADFSLTIKKADQSFTFAHAESDEGNRNVRKEYGLTAFETKINASALNSGVVHYAVSENTIGAAVDINGLVTFVNSTGKVGTVTVTVTMEGNDCYNPYSDTYDITLSYAAVPASPYTLHGDKIITGSDWFTSDVLIFAANDYQISFSNALEGNKWENSVTWDKDGDAEFWAKEENKASAPVVYLKNIETGAITDAIPVTDLKRDTEKPGSFSIDYKTDVLATIGEKLFGIHATEVQVSISATDAMSGISKVEYSLDDGDTYTEVHVNEAGKYGFTSPAQCRGQLWIKVTDVAGHTEIYKHMDGDAEKILVVDQTAPGLTVGYTGTTDDHATEGIRYAKGDQVTIVVETSDENFDLREFDPVVTVNGTEKTEWVFTDTMGTLTFNLIEEGDYTIHAEFTDRLGRKVEHHSELRIDRTEPVIEVSYDNDSALNENCYKDDRTATITITEHNFKAENVVVSVTAKNLLEPTVSVMDYAAYAKDPANWNSEGDVHTLELPFTVDAIYDFSVDYTDLSGSAAAGYETEFVVDHAAATDIEISYSIPILEKVWQFFSFGIYQAKAEVTITAKDITSGVDYFVLTYTKANGSSSINKETFTTDPIAAVRSSTDANVFTATYTLEHEADGTFSVVLFDKAGNESEKSDSKRIVVDQKNPEVKAQYEFASGEHNYENNIYYTQGNVSVKFTINEANFHLAEAPVVTVNGVARSVEWTAAEDEDVWVGEILLSGDGDYKVKVTFTDASTNVMDPYQQEIRIDSKEPVIDVSYDNNSALNENCYQDNRTATVTITEHNFKAENVTLDVDAVDIMGDPVSVMDYEAYAKDPANWTSEGDVHKLEVPFTTDAIYTVTVNCEDLAGNTAANNQPVFVVDHTPASNIQITYSTPIIETIIEKLTFGFYKAEVVVTVTAEDLTSGVDYFELSYTRDEDATDVHMDDFTQKLTAQPGADAKTFTASYTVPAQARGSYSVQVYDRAGNVSESNDNDTVIVTDTVASNIKIEYTELTNEKGFRDKNGNVVGAKDAAKFYYNKDVVATITIEEANFFEGKKAGKNDEGIVHQILLKVTKTDDNGVVTVKEYLCAGAEQLVADADKETIEWTTNGDIHTTSITLAEDGDYVLELSYQDFSGNNAPIDGTDGNAGNINYTSRIITVDKTAPVINVSYDNYSALNENCYKDNRTATITVTEHNFKTEEFVVDVTAKNLMDDVAVADYAAAAQNPDNWTHDGNVHILKLLFEKDAIYTLDVSYTDVAGNAAADFAEQCFVVDHTDADNIQITYSTPVLSKIIEALSFGFYKAEVVVTVTAEDLTSGVDYFELSYTKDPAATDAHTNSFTQKLAAQPGTNAKTFTASYTVPAQARGSYSVKVFDRAGNDSDANDYESVIVTDTISPEMKVDYAAKDPDTKAHFVDSSMKDVDTFAEAANAFYNGDVVATITVNEANFFEGKKAGENNDEIVHEIIMKVTKTDNHGDVTVKEYLCAGAEQLVAGAEKEIIEWTTNGDTHTASITFADDGDYVLEITYIDFSENASEFNGNDGVAATETYTSKVITVDETAPVIDVSYGNTEVINTIEDRKYFNKAQSAVITVTEHNFRAEDIAAVVTAKNAVGTDVPVADFAAQLADEKNWTHNGDVHTAEVQYTVDANYTFDIDFEDLALNASADYQQDLFTVDTTAPGKLEVKYSTSFFEQVLESVTFGYYNAQMTVTITAEDDTSGIYYFAYSYINSEGVSGVNKELLDQAIQEAEITYDGKKATATFTVPKMVLGNDNQFNGTVAFMAYDRSENSTDLKDSTRIIVDNISPTASVTYNAPVQNANGSAYYDGNISGTIVINEANFDAADVQVTVTRNGAAYPVRVTWYDNSVDTHTGSFVLSEDGDYIVSIQYKDKSGNQMADYTSQKLVLDATKPSIKVSNIKANSANKDDRYGFVIEISDTNLDAASMKPVLKTVQKNADGVYAVVEIDLGKANAVVNGQTYTYTVENLPDDGLYTLTCEAKDLSGNALSQIVLEDGEAHDQVQFSINRNGSAFSYGNTFAEKLVGQCYVYSVDEDVVIVEVNVDPIEEYTVSLNGKELTEGKDYTTEQTSKSGEWSKRTYTISKELFSAEGEYSIIVTSTDKTNTTAFSDVKNLAMSFVVDQTKPVLTITGLEAGGRYQTDAQTVTLIPTDEGGRLNKLSIVVLDANGEPLMDANGENISVRFEMAGEELLKYLQENDGKVTFTVPEGLNNRVQIICNDCAVNAEDLTNEYNELFNNVTVSRNQLVIFYANTPLFYGTIIGVLALIALIIFLIKRKKDKKAKA